MNTAGSNTSRLPPAPRQPYTEHHSERLSTLQLRQGDERENATDALSALFFAAGSEFISAEEAPHQPPPSPDWQQLQQELYRHTAEGAAEACSFTLLLPDSGEVDVTLATRQPIGWEVALRFSPSVYLRWQRQASLCQRLLRQALKGPVHLTIEQEEAP
ncbi:type III secretion system HrpP C-terminal domain-containing protein [Serratia marcescens]|uniref:type III secretion system HrpP C-terminal domain-containing protein n=1 Tax=Serratia marcescens TaxID=615 RepID=UPI000D73B845|nr:type III secretion system HrpP C-terminal domain-containing protein [Serratia marcescens]AWO77465.1 type III secretion system protein [Serratia marcescens]